MPTILKHLSVVCFALLASANAIGASFFGEDVNNTDNPGTVADDPARIAHPNSDSARAQFLAGLSGVTTANFESLADGAATPIPVSFGSATATITGNASVRDQPADTFNGTYPISGTQFLLSSAGGIGTLTVTFSSPQVAFGFYGTDIADGSGQLTVTVNFEAGGSTTYNVPHSIPSGSGSVLYFGIIDELNPFTSVVFGNTLASVDGFGFDDFTIADADQVGPPTPLPANQPIPTLSGWALALLTVMLLVAGAASVPRLRRR